MSDRKNLTPIPFAAFSPDSYAPTEEPPALRKLSDTDKAPPPETAEDRDCKELNEAVSRLEEALNAHAEDIRSGINGLRTIILRQHEETRKRLDNHAAVARWLVAETQAIRELSAFPAVEPPTDDL